MVMVPPQINKYYFMDGRIAGPGGPVSRAPAGSSGAGIGSQRGQLWRLVAVALDDEFFGQDSRRMKAGSFAMLGHSVVGCKNLGQALERSLSFYGLILDDISGTLKREAGRLASCSTAHRRSARVFGNEVLLLLLHGVACWLVGRRIPILRAQFGYPERDHSAEYRLMYCTDLAFGKACTRSPSTRHLELPIVQKRERSRSFCARRPRTCDQIQKPQQPQRPIRRRLRQQLPGEVPDFEKLAGELSMTTATVRRRLRGGIPRASRTSCGATSPSAISAIRIAA